MSNKYGGELDRSRAGNHSRDCAALRTGKRSPFFSTGFGAMWKSTQHSSPFSVIGHLNQWITDKVQLSYRNLC
jgi:hypothetical protein